MVTSVLNFEAIEQSRKKGEVRGKAELLLKFLRKKGIEDEAVIDKVMREEDQKTIETWFEIAMDGTLDQIRAIILR